MSTRLPAEVAKIVRAMGVMLVCPKCRQIVRDAMSLKCQHHYCPDCIQEMNTGAGELVRARLSFLDSLTSFPHASGLVVEVFGVRSAVVAKRSAPEHQHPKDCGGVSEAPISDWFV
jgi:hypothetical protein